MSWHWIPLIALGVAVLFFVVGYSAHPREHVKRVRDGKLISPEYQCLFDRDVTAAAAKKGEKPPFVEEHGKRELRAELQETRQLKT